MALADELRSMADVIQQNAASMLECSTSMRLLASKAAAADPPNHRPDPASTQADPPNHRDP